MEVDPMEILYDATPSAQHEEHEDGVDYIEDLRMAANDGTLPGRGSFKKPTTNTRRIWTTREEKCEEALKDDFPKTDLQASPHITSKLTTWKKSYSSLVTVHTTTGLGFNTTTSQLECTDDQWESIVKVDIFGLDRATGSVAEDVVEMAKRLKLMYGKPPPVVENQEHDGANYGSEPHRSDGIDGIRGNDPTEGDSTAHGASNITRDTTNGARKKRKRSPESNGPSNME
ncbi:hypothetical protein ACS0TY_021126 [Phlomoides rotata]